MQVEWRVLLAEEFRFIFAAIVLIGGMIAGYLIGRANKRLLTAAGIPDAVEGTPFERTAQSLGTTTVSLVARLSSWFIYGVAVLIALNVAELLTAWLFWRAFVAFIPHLFVAVLVFISGFVAADKAELIVSERLRSVKLPEVGIIPRVVKYTIVYVSVLISLSQIGVSTGALLVLFAAYVFAVILLSGLAFRDLLGSSAAGIYLLLNQPYGIGDEIEVDGNQGIVQEVDVFVTHIESEGKEYIIPNHLVFREGVVRIRD